MAELALSLKWFQDGHGPRLEINYANIVLFWIFFFKPHSFCPLCLTKASIKLRYRVLIVGSLQNGKVVLMMKTSVVVRQRRGRTVNGIRRTFNEICETTFGMQGETDVSVIHPSLEHKREKSVLFSPKG